MVSQHPIYGEDEEEKKKKDLKKSDDKDKKKKDPINEIMEYLEKIEEGLPPRKAGIEHSEV